MRLIHDDQIPRHIGQRGLHVGLAGKGGRRDEARRGGPELEVAAQAVAVGDLELDQELVAQFALPLAGEGRRGDDERAQVGLPAGQLFI